MSVPGYQQFMLPLLRILQDGTIHSASDYMETIATQFQLSEEDRQEMLKSGQQTVLKNRVGWAATYLSKAGLLSRVGKGEIQITPLGIDVLSKSPAEINNQFLRQFPGFEEFQKGSNQSTVKGKRPSPPSPFPHEPVELSPNEQLEVSYTQLRSALAQELLDRIKSASPAFFEQLVVDLLVAMGYGGSRTDAGQAVGGSGDGGIDGIIKEDRLGLDFVYLQAKRWEGVVGRPVVQGFAGSLEGARARKGVMITTSSFSKDALDYVRRIEKRIVLIDGERLAQYMLDFGIGVSEIAHYRVQRVDLAYFGEE